MTAQFIIKRICLAAMPSIIGCISFAQDAAAAPKSTGSSYNTLAVVMIIMATVLAFVIWWMGQVLIALGKQVIEKSSSTKIIGLVLITCCLLASQTLPAQDVKAAEVVQTVPNFGGLSSTTFYIFLTVLGMELITILFFAFSIKRLYVELMPEKEKKPSVQRARLSSYWSMLDKKLFTKAIPVEKEADHLLGHDYDGIRELDNSLPPWWKYGFYVTIVIAFIYLLNFHVLGLGKNPEQEYAAEMENARIQKERYEAMNKDRVDESNVPMANADGIKAGQVMFEANCVACHLKGGAGSVGPNLTDDYWIHKGSLTDIYTSIKNGWPDKGMQAWNTKFNPKEISQLASYIKSLKGTNPPGAKLPQGEMYMDSVTVNKPDSAVMKKTGTETASSGK